MKLNITSRLALVLMLFAAGLVFSVTLLYYNFAQRSLQERRNLLASLSKSPEITTHLQNLQQDPDSQSILQAAMRTHLEMGSP